MKKRFASFSIFLLLLVLLLVLVFLFRDEERVYAAAGERKIATIVVDDFPMTYEDGSWETVGDLIEASGEDIREGDEIFPSRETLLSSGMKIMVTREKNIRIAADSEERSIVTIARTVSEALDETGIDLREDDIVIPDLSALLDREEEIQIIRVEIREETVEKPIPFETVEKEDNDMGWRERVVKQKGENGTREYRYRVSYHDGEEVARKLLGNEVTKEPTDEVVVQGTYVKTGKSHTGAASWYAHTGTMSAANPWLPMGSYVRVTNQANGKSVIVKINDRGPFVPGRIIDLDKVAFQEIASIGAGVIDVKMEEIVN